MNSSAQVHHSTLLLLLRVNILQHWRRLKSIRKQSRLLVGAILSFLLGYLALSFWLFLKGLRFVAAFPGLGPVLTERLLHLLFALLFAMLLLSNLIISYSNLFRNPETAFLLSLPVSRQTIFRWKFIESTLLASWAFLFLVAPFLAAFGLNQSVRWHFYAVTLLSMALFIVLPGVAGSWLAIYIARYLDRRSFQVAAGAAVLGLLLLAGSWWRAQPATNELLETRVLDMLDQILVKTRFAQFPFLPSYWLSNAVIHWAEGVINLAGFFILVLLSNVAFFGFLAFTRLGSPFYEAISVVQSRTSIYGRWNWRRSAPRTFSTDALSLFERSWNRLTFIPADIRALVLKDLRLFWRDTAQWGQSVMLFGLLGAYLINLRHFTHQLSSPFWVNLISFLNLGACSLNLATLTTRFVFPQFSLEGSRLWIVGLAPLGLARVIKTKFWLAGISSWVVTATLITISCFLLKMPWDRIAFFGAVVTIMTFSLNGLAIGLGVLYPNLKEAIPSKIVSGFGGTLCLVLSFLYILASVLALGFGASGIHPHLHWVFASICGFTLLSLLTGWLPLKLALRHVQNFSL